MKKAFTLIELLIATSLAVIIMITGFYLLSNHTKLFQKINKNVARQQICSIVLDRMTEDIQSAQKVSSLSSPSNLILVFPTYNISYDYKNGKVRRKKGGGSSYLTDEGDVNLLFFSYKGNLVTITIDGYESKAYCRN